MRRITRHGKRRIKERTNQRKNYKGVLTRVLRYGDSKDKYVGEFYRYLTRRSRKGARLKVYSKNIYVIAKNSKNLITVYPVPKRFFPLERYKLNRDTIDSK